MTLNKFGKHFFLIASKFTLEVAKTFYPNMLSSKLLQIHFLQKECILISTFYMLTQM
jgi:hypothetical protein